MTNTWLDTWGEINWKQDSESVLKQVKNLLHEYGTGSDIINMRSGNGGTPLHDASLYGHASVVELLISYGAKVNARSVDRFAPLHNAAYSGNKEVVEMLIAHGADVNTESDNGVTPLHNAAYQDYREIAEILIAHGAEVNAQADNGCTPLHNAVKRENKWMAELLIKNGANWLIENEWGETPYYLGSNDMKCFLRELNNPSKQTLKQTLSTEQVSAPAAAKGEVYALSDEYTRGNDVSISIVNPALMKNKGR